MKKRSRQINVRITREPPREYVYTVVIHPGDKDENGYWAEVPALQGCNTQGNTYQETVENARDAIMGYLEMLAKLGEPIPVERQPKKTITAAVQVEV